MLNTFYLFSISITQPLPGFWSTPPWWRTPGLRALPSLLPLWLSFLSGHWTTGKRRSDSRCSMRREKNTSSRSSVMVKNKWSTSTVLLSVTLCYLNLVKLFYVTASFSGHNVQCDKSGTTGKSDAIKKLSYCECIALRERQLAKFDPDSAPDDSESTHRSWMNVNPSSLDLLGYMNCFVQVVSGSKVIEGIGPYLVITIRPKSFNRRIIMGMSSVCLTVYVHWQGHL